MYTKTFLLSLFCICISNFAHAKTSIFHPKVKIHGTSTFNRVEDRSVFRYSLHSGSSFGKIKMSGTGRFSELSGQEIPQDPVTYESDPHSLLEFSMSPEGDFYLTRTKPNKDEQPTVQSFPLTKESGKWGNLNFGGKVVFAIARSNREAYEGMEGSKSFREVMMEAMLALFSFPDNKAKVHLGSCYSGPLSYFKKDAIRHFEVTKDSVDVIEPCEKIEIYVKDKDKDSFPFVF